MVRFDRVGMCYPSGDVGLHPTCLEFAKGDFTVLLGTSGAGKSTLLRCINFLNNPSSGEIHVDGASTVCRGRGLRAHRRKTAMIFQQHQLIGRHSALDNVLVARLPEYGVLRGLFPLPRHERIFALECLERVGLLEKALERADNLSGGQQQRVGIARALAQRPQLILADEPVASLDPATSEKVLSLLHRITREDGLTAIVSLHQVEFAKKYADRIIGLSSGSVVFDGTAENLTRTALEQIYDKDGDGDHEARAA